MQESAGVEEIGSAAKLSLLSVSRQVVPSTPLGKIHEAIQVDILASNGFK